MNESIRIDLTGRNAVVWDRVFATLTGTVERAIDALGRDMPAAQVEAAKQSAMDIATIAKGWAKAKIQAPELANERTIADICLQFEQAKLIAAQRRQVQVDTEIRVVELEKHRLELWERRLQLALRWMSFFEKHIVRNADGSVTLLLSNRAVAQMTHELKRGSEDDSL